MNTDQTIHFESILVSLMQLRVWLGPREIHFTQNELRVLLVFLQEPHRTISSDELVRRADLTSPDALHHLICRLRALLEQQYIYTQRGGYSFTQKGRLDRARAGRAVTAETPTQKGNHAKTI